MGLRFSNNAVTTLATPPSPGTSGLAFTVADGSAFRTYGGTDYTYLTRDNGAGGIEIFKVVARSGNSFTIASGGRGLDGTTAVAWNAGDIIEQRLPNIALEELLALSIDPEILALASVTSAADRLFYFNGAGSGAVAVFTAFSRTLLDDSDQVAARATLGTIAKTGDSMTGQLSITSTGNNAGLLVTGSGTGPGIVAQGGAANTTAIQATGVGSGSGGFFLGGASGGAGVTASASGAGAGGFFTGGLDGPGVLAQSGGNFHAVLANGGVSGGHALYGQAGNTAYAGAIGFSANGSKWAALGHADSYGVYCNGEMRVTGVISAQAGLDAVGDIALNGVSVLTTATHPLAKSGNSVGLSAVHGGGTLNFSVSSLGQVQQIVVDGWGRITGWTLA